MGGNQSSPLETQDEYIPGGSEQYAIDQAAILEAAAEANRQQQERIKAEAAENDRKAQEAFAKLLAANTDFSRPSGPTLELTVPKSFVCAQCDIIIEKGISSSTVVLSRDILGKIDIPKKEYPPSNLPEDALVEGDEWLDRGNHNKTYYLKAADGTFRSRTKTFSSVYSPPFPGSDFPEVLSKADVETMAGRVEYNKKYADQSFVEFANKKKIDAENRLEKKRVRMWNPSETKGDNGAVAINYKTHGALTKVYLKNTIPFTVGFNFDRVSISVMSLYHPFPLRVDGSCETGRQYDACLQVGEFSSSMVAGSKIVILVPLKVAVRAGESGVFINAVANKLPSILGQQPDKIEGYPDVPAQPGSDWVIEKVVKLDQAFYTWINQDGTRVIVMANPIKILSSDMSNIKRLPLTPPQDVIHEIGAVYYKKGLPINCNPLSDGENIPCKPNPFSSILNNLTPPDNSGATKPKVDSEDFLKVIFGILGVVVVILGIWLGVKLAMGPGSTFMKSIGDSLGRSLSGGYDAIKKAKLPAMPAMPAMPESLKTTRGNLGSRLGIGATGKFGPKRQAPVDKPIDEVLPVLKPSEDFEMTNPLFKSKDDFAKFQNKTRKNPKQGTIGAIANLPATNIPGGPLPPHLRGRKTNVASTLRNPKQGTIGAIANLPAANIPEPDMPSGVTVNPIVNRRRTQRNKISSVDDINRRKVPMNNALRKISANSQAKKGSFQNIVRRAQAVDKLSNQGSAMQELNDLENNLNKEKRQLRKNLLKKSSVVNAFNTTKKSQPEPGAGTGLLPSPAPAPAPVKRRKIMQEEEDEDEPPKNDRDDEYDPTKLFGSKFLRKSYGFNHGGKKKHRKTGRKI